LSAGNESSLVDMLLLPASRLGLPHSMQVRSNSVEGSGQVASPQSIVGTLLRMASWPTAKDPHEWLIDCVEADLMSVSHDEQARRELSDARAIIVQHVRVVGRITVAEDDGVCCCGHPYPCEALKVQARRYAAKEDCPKSLLV